MTVCDLTEIRYSLNFLPTGFGYRDDACRQYNGQRLESPGSSERRTVDPERSDRRQVDAISTSGRSTKPSQGLDQEQRDGPLPTGKRAKSNQSPSPYSVA